jgi:hypothetical protein
MDETMTRALSSNPRIGPMHPERDGLRLQPIRPYARLQPARAVGRREIVLPEGDEAAEMLSERGRRAFDVFLGDKARQLQESSRPCGNCFSEIGALSRSGAAIFQGSESGEEIYAPSKPRQ